MRGFILSLFLIICAYSSFAQTQVAKKTSGGIGYLEYLPAGYTSSSTPYPCIIFLHGSGERGDGSPAALEKLKAQGIPKNIKNGSKMCFTVNGKTECFVVLSPQTNEYFWKNGDGVTTKVIPFLKYALQNYNIDPNRIYLTGLSMGGEGTWEAASYYENEPNYFAAIAPVASGKYANYNDGCNVANKKIATWAFHGSLDASNSVWSGEQPVKGMIDCNANPAAIWTLYPGLNHGQTWERAYKEDHSYHNPNMYEWFLNQKRNPNIKPPITNAGVNAQIILPANSITLSGTATDTDGTIASTVWKVVSGPSGATISNINTLTPTFSGLKKGTYNISLTSADNQGNSTTDLVYVNVNPATAGAPVANAGSDKTITLPTTSVIANGTGTDSDGTISSYAWTKISGGAATLTNASTASLTASGLTPGTYVFRLTVTDNSGASHFDEATVTVNPATNIAPVANSGVDKLITLPASSIVLTGSATDSDGTISTYAWTKTSGGTATLANTSTTSLIVNNLLVGTYVFRLTVTDNSGATHYDEVTVTVNPAPNVGPVANAGADGMINPPTNSIVLAGTGTDSDGTIATYTWAQISGGTSTLTNASTPSLTASGLTAGTYVFRLSVTDNAGATHYDEATVTVNTAVTNVAPVANAGPDRNITFPLTTVTLYGSASDPDGTISTYAWTKVAGRYCSMSGIATPTLLVTNLPNGTFVFRLTVTDNSGATTTDDITLIVNPIPPIADAGPDVQITLPVNNVVISGSGTDPDGTVAGYIWSKVLGPAATLTNITTPALTVEGLTKGTHAFRLKVTDNNGASSTDDVTVIVNGSGINIAPVANAGVDKLITLPTNSTVLTGTGTDSDGTISSYTWTQISGGGSSLTNASTASLTASGLVIGTYVFRLTVTDNLGATQSDNVTINVVQQVASQASSARSSTNHTETVLGEESSAVEESMATGLSQNYPNPFTTSTTIPFSIKKDQRVVVKVYDFYGTEIQTLVNEELKAGEHTVAFTPAVPNQFFLIKLVADGKLHSIKAIQL